MSVIQITAAGSTQNDATAVQLFEQMCLDVAVVSSGSGIRLPFSQSNSNILISNNGANSLSIYPPVGGTIDGGSVNSPISLSSGSKIVLYSILSTGNSRDWYSFSASGGGGSGTVTSITAGAGLSGGTITTSGTVALETTGLELDAFSSVITTDIDGSTITFNMATSNWHSVTLGASGRTLAVSNVSVGQQFTIVLVQGGSGSNTVTWFSGIKWAGGSAPTLTTTTGKADILTFKCYGSGNYYGFVAGQDF